MKRISYGGASILTGDRIADALLDYAAALARAGTADHIRVPGVAMDDGETVFDIVLGPASQLMAEHEDVLLADLIDEGFIDDLAMRTKMAALGRTDQIGRAEA